MVRLLRAMRRHSIAATILAFAGSTGLQSQQTESPQSLDMQVLQQEINHLAEELRALQAQLSRMQQTQSAPPPAGQTPAAAQPLAQNPAPPVKRPGAPDTAPGATTPGATGVNPLDVATQTIGEHQPTTAEQQNHRFFERKPGKDLTFFTKSGELTVYGNLDVSFDVMTKGISSLIGPDGLGPVGNVGWMPDISTNISYIGIRGTQATGIRNMNFVYQLETQLDISATSGASETNSTMDNAVKGALTSRNSFIGLGSPNWGAAVFGKTDAPYKLSTTRLNPFYGTIGDYAAIMGNTGGDTRVEFGTRLDHSIWFTSKDLHGFGLATLFSPGQNRSNINNNIAAGEPDCTGGDNPGDGGNLPLGCNDGGFGNAVSTSVTYTREPLYMFAAYEWHMKVNRQSDLTGQFANVPPAYFNADVANEDAGKVGVQYTFARKTTVGAIYETLHRYVPGFLEFQNERQRQGSWLAFTQALSANDSFSAGWARAYRTPGDPGQHNTSLELPPLGAPGDTTGGRGVDNSANLFTAAYKHRIAEGLTAYAVWAANFNGPYGHFDLGAGGRGVTTDCHDASDAVGDENSDPHCWAGGHLKGVSLGLDKRF
jgi:predicted porin